MPNMSSHMSVAKRVGDILNIKDKEFIKGNLLPDLYNDKVKSHYKIQGKIYLIPDIDYVINNLDLNNKLNLGILTHLLLDKYYLVDYLGVKYKDNIIDGSKDIYNDYDIINQDIVNHFKLDIGYLNNILTNYEQDIDEEKLDYNLKCLNINKKGKTTYLNKKEFIDFLEKVSIRIAKEIKEIIN